MFEKDFHKTIGQLEKYNSFCIFCGRPDSYMQCTCQDAKKVFDDVLGRLFERECERMNDNMKNKFYKSYAFGPNSCNCDGESCEDCEGCTCINTEEPNFDSNYENVSKDEEGSEPTPYDVTHYSNIGATFDEEIEPDEEISEHDKDISQSDEEISEHEPDEIKLKMHDLIEKVKVLGCLTQIDVLDEENDKNEEEKSRRIVKEVAINFDENKVDYITFTKTVEF